MKAPVSKTIAADQNKKSRCQFPFADGRRCAMSRWSRHRTFCLPHAREEQRLLAIDEVGRELGSISGEFKTTNDVNRALGKVFALFAQNRLARRDAVAFAYMGQLLLQSIPGVKHEIREHLGYDAWHATVLESVSPPATQSEPIVEETPIRESKPSRKNKSRKNKTSPPQAGSKTPQKTPQQPPREAAPIENEKETEFDGMAALRSVFSQKELADVGCPPSGFLAQTPIERASEVRSAVPVDALPQTPPAEPSPEKWRREHVPQSFYVDAMGVPHFS